MNRRLNPGRRRQIGLLGCLLLILVFGCRQKKDSPESGKNSKPTVVVANEPLRFFVNELIGESVRVLGPGNEVDPGSWMPNDQMISEMQDADLILTVGAHYEKWPDFVSLPQSVLVEVTRPMIADFIKVEGEVHKHGPEGEAHSHSGLASGFWLDPKLGKTMMGHVADALIATYPDEKDVIESNRKRLEAQFEKLIQLIGKRGPKFSVVFSSDTKFLYLSRSLGHEDVYFFWTSHGIEDLPEDAWSNLDKKLETHPASVMLFTLEPSAETRAELEKRNISVWLVDTLEGKGDGDYFARLEKVIRKLSLGGAAD